MVACSAPGGDQGRRLRGGNKVVKDDDPGLLHGVARFGDGVGFCCGAVAAFELSELS